MSKSKKNEKPISPIYPYIPKLPINTVKGAYFMLDFPSSNNFHMVSPFAVLSITEEFNIPYIGPTALEGLQHRKDQTRPWPKGTLQGYVNRVPLQSHILKHIKTTGTNV